MVIITERWGFPLCHPTNLRSETGLRHLNVEDASEDPNRNWKDEERTNG
jgi:hypothetical protein